jgi:hypothetical protein
MRRAARDGWVHWRRSSLRNGLLLGGLVAIVLTITRLVVSAEAQTFYWWDYAYFPDLAQQTARAFTVSLSSGVEFVIRSLSWDYNALFALPLLPFMRVAPTRFSYVLGLAIVYLLPLALALGSVAARLLPGRRVALFWTTATVCLLTPMMWVPVLRGYPDAGAALLVVLATRAYLGDPRLQRTRQILWIGFLLAGAALFRRHFLFAISAFLGAMTPCVLAAGWGRQRGRDVLRWLLASFARVAATGIAAALALTLLGLPFVMRVLRRDFYALYASYLASWRENAVYYLSPYGLLGWALAVVGFALATRTRLADRVGVLFLVCLGSLSLLQWVSVVRQLAEVYTLHFTPALVLGAVALGCCLWVKGRGVARVVLVGAGCVYLAANMFLGLSGNAMAASHAAWRPLFAKNWPPLRNEDRASLVALVDALRNVSGPDDPILVAASSDRLNDHLVLNAERALYGARARLRILDLPCIDTRDQYPLDQLIQAKFVVVAQPTQYHLPAREQKLVKLVADIFSARVNLAQDFELLPTQIAFRGGLRAQIYRRLHPSSLATGLSALQFMRQVIPVPPGLQANWVVASQLFPSWATRRDDSGTDLVIHPGRLGEEPSATAVYLGGLGGAVSIDGAATFLDRRCEGALLTARLVDSEGRPLAEERVAKRPGDAPAFVLKLHADTAAGLQLVLSNQRVGDSIDYCLMELQAVRTVGG